MTRAALLAGGLLAAGALAGCGAATTVTVTGTLTVTLTRTVTTAPPATASACRGSELTGTFTVVPGSAGAGQIVYLLTVTNTGRSTCFVSGLPAVQLLAVNGKALPTHPIAARPGAGSAARILLTPGESASAQARFSPDVAGTGDHQTGACQPQAATLRVTPNGGGTLDAAIDPPTSVCEQGQLQLDLYASVS